jgi:chromosome partitioning protein
LSQASAHIIVMGNEKGGTGKSTLAMHITVSLLTLGKRVAIIDLDSRQQTISRYLENRARYISSNDIQLDIPPYVAIPASDNPDLKQRQQEEQDCLQAALDIHLKDADFIVLDCPGNDTWLSRLAHAMADTLVTPMNDSFIDLDLLGHVNPEDYQVGKLSYYSEMVWSSRKLRSLGGKPPMDWVVVRNRIANINSYNKQRMDAALKALQDRIMFRYVPGLHDRVVYRELFPKGLTFLDLEKTGELGKTRMSHVATRYEIRQLLQGLNLPQYEGDNRRPDQ